MTRQNHSCYEEGAGEGLLVTRILLYLPRYKKSGKFRPALWDAYTLVLWALASNQSVGRCYSQASYARGDVNSPLQKRVAPNYAGGAKGVIEYGMCSTT